MSAYYSSFADASRIVEKEVNEFIGLLPEEGKAHLDTIGAVSYTHLDVYKRQPLCKRYKRGIRYCID